MTRGDVVLVRFPHSSGARGKKRPAVVVQADGYNSCLLLATVDAELVDRVVGTLSQPLQSRLGDCLKAALGVP